MKIKCLDPKYIVCGTAVVGEFKFAFSDVTFVATGKAICRPNDTFDVTVGKRIAYRKAKLKAIHYFMSALKRVEKNLAKTVREAAAAHKYLDEETTYIENFLSDPLAN